jgi:hypothetical protein
MYINNVPTSELKTHWSDIDTPNETAICNYGYRQTTKKGIVGVRIDGARSKCLLFKGAHAPFNFDNNSCLALKVGVLY